MFAGAQLFAQPTAQKPAIVTTPGKERWPVKTGQDPDRDAVGKNIVNGQDLGAGIVPATVEELISTPRPAGLQDATIDPPEFQSKRAGTVETTIWRVEGNITVLNQEADGDYHLVFQGASGATLVAEVPTPTTAFVGDSPWLQNIKEARQAVDDKLIHTLSPRDFLQHARSVSDSSRGRGSADANIPNSSEAHSCPDYGRRIFRPCTWGYRGRPQCD